MLVRSSKILWMPLNTWYELAMYSLWTIARDLVRLFIMVGGGGVRKFKFVFLRWSPVAATLFCLEFIYYYITCNLTVLILRGKTTTWFALSSDSCAATNVQLIVLFFLLFNLYFTVYSAGHLVNFSNLIAK